MQLLAHAGEDEQTQLFLTVAIPHYKHRSYLEIALQSLFEQKYTNFEIVVSDDCSPDDSAVVIPNLLIKSNRPFRYYLQESNLGYDGNVRFCLAHAQGRYVLLLGNDDALNGPTCLEELAEALKNLDYPAVAFTNYADWATNNVTRRAHSTTNLGCGPFTAARFFRTFSFVSGLVYDRMEAALHETDRWDRSVYYQIYLACRVIAAGGIVAALDICAVRKDIQINNQTVPNYVQKASTSGWSFRSRQTGLDSVIRVAADAISPYVDRRQSSSIVCGMIAQIYLISYPFWLLEYRRVANWSYSIGVARDVVPSRILPEHKLRWLDQSFLWFLYTIVTIIGLVFPIMLYTRSREYIATQVRRWQQTMGKPVPNAQTQ